MPRPRICRRTFFNPRTIYFKPAGIPLKHLEESLLEKDELEAIRLIDYKQVDQTRAARQMQVSQPTLSRILLSARKKIAEAIIKGKAIKINNKDLKTGKITD